MKKSPDLPFDTDFDYNFGVANYGLHCYYCFNEKGFTPNHLHFHTRYELMLISKGSVRVINNESDIRVKAPCVLLHAPSTYHVVLADTDSHYERFFIYFDTDELSDVDRIISSAKEYVQKCSFRVYDSIGNDMDKLIELFKVFYSLTDRGAQLGLAMTSAIISELMHYSCSYTSAFPKQSKNMLECIEYINLHFAENITAESIAEHFFMGRVTFFCNFKRMTSFSPHEYIALLRMNLARRLLSRGIASVDVATQCGYNTFSTFTRTFRTYMGMSPQEYRQKFVKDIDV